MSAQAKMQASQERITQKHLVLLQSIQARAELKRKRALHAERLVWAKLRDGAEVEPGVLDLQVIVKGTGVQRLRVVRRDCA